MLSSSRARLALAAGAAAALVGAMAVPSSAFAASAHPRVPVPNAQPELAGARATATPASGQKLQVRVHLALRSKDTITDAIKAVSDPSSSSYHRYLTPAQFRARYSPTQASVDTVRSFLSGYGVKVTDVTANRTTVTAVGTVSQLEAAFGTTLRTYQLDGKQVRAAATAVSVPKELQGVVLGVSGLASHSTLVSPSRETNQGRIVPRTSYARAAKATGSAPPPDAFVNAPPLSSYFGEKLATTVPTAYGKVQPYATRGYTPSQLESVYGLGAAYNAGITGKGVRVAITDAYASPLIVKDANTYSVKYKVGGFGAGQFRQILPSAFQYGYDDTENGDQCDERGWYGEETLDVEAVHAVAPKANVLYVAAASCDNLDLADALDTVVDGHLADIITNSWGGTDESNGSAELDSIYEQIFVQAALEGIGVYYSSGDNGDGSALNNGVPTAEAPANSPWVTAVGGTSLGVDAKGKRLFETGWSTSKSILTDSAWSPALPGNYVYGAGGGTSQVFTQPWYQRTVVPVSLSTRYSDYYARVIPDVAAIGDPNTGFLIGETQTFPDGSTKYSEYRIGGTSLASPVFAGIMALADQAAGFKHGFANPALYAKAGTPSFYDEKPITGLGVVRVDYVNGVDASDGFLTSLRTIDSTVTTTLAVAPGYDDITGIGSPNGFTLIKALKKR